MTAGVVVVFFLVGKLVPRFAERPGDPYASVVEAVGRVLGIEAPAEEPACEETSAATAAAGGQNP